MRLSASSVGVELENILQIKEILKTIFCDNIIKLIISNPIKNSKYRKIIAENLWTQNKNVTKEEIQMKFRPGWYFNEVSTQLVYIDEIDILKTPETQKAHTIICKKRRNTIISREKRPKTLAH